MSSASEALYDPLLLAERAPVVLLDPELHTAIVEGVVTLTPHHCVCVCVCVCVCAHVLVCVRMLVYVRVVYI